MQNLNQFQRGHLRFPALQAGYPFLLGFPLVDGDVTFDLIGNCDYFGFGFLMLIWKLLLKFFSVWIKCFPSLFVS